MRLRVCFVRVSITLRVSPVCPSPPCFERPASKYLALYTLKAFLWGQSSFRNPQTKQRRKHNQDKKMRSQICSSFSLFIVSQDIHSIQELVHDGDRIYMRHTRVRRGPITWVDHTLGGGPSYMFCGSIQIGSAVVNDFFFVKPPNQWPPFCHLICKRSYNRKCMWSK